jgi:hypothetical protein
LQFLTRKCSAAIVAASGVPIGHGTAVPYVSIVNPSFRWRRAPLQPAISLCPSQERRTMREPEI